MEVFTSANNYYIITELCDGDDIETRVRLKGPIEERDARKLIYEVYQGLKYLAEQNIVHRDIKIANIFLKSGVAKIADFGFAKRTTYPV
jgi:tousled-like kinase